MATTFNKVALRQKNCYTLRWSESEPLFKMFILIFFKMFWALGQTLCLSMSLEELEMYKAQERIFYCDWGTCCIRTDCVRFKRYLHVIWLNKAFVKMPSWSSFAMQKWCSESIEMLRVSSVESLRQSPSSSLFSTSCALCMQPCTNNRWGSFYSLLFNGGGAFHFPFHPYYPAFIDHSTISSRWRIWLCVLWREVIRN